jgi:hypothetical protein
MNMLDLPCVSISAAMAKRHNITDKKQLPAPNNLMNELVVALSIAKPLWTFSLVSGSFHSAKDYGVEVYQGGEKLGSVSWTWFRNNYAFSIDNHRIAKDKVRTSVYRTADIKKALAAIKKSFFRQNHNERLAEAGAAVDKLVHNEAYEKLIRANKAKKELDAQALAFAYASSDTFKEYLKAHTKYHVWELHETADLEMVTIDAAKKAHQNGRSVIVIRDGGQYIVKLRDKVEIMDDTTLPSWLKAKLGMLKLVEDDHFVSDVGCRVDAECFMVLAQNDEEQI